MTAKKQIKKSLFQICDIRQDSWTEAVQVGLSDTRCSSYLHAANERYQEDCPKRFTNVK